MMRIQPNHNKIKTLGRRIILGAALILIASFLAGCATVPYTGRSSLNLVPDSQLISLSFSEYQKVLAKSKLSTDRSKTAMVRRVGQRVARASEKFMRENGLGSKIKDYRWEFNLIDDDKMINAWAMPGGKIAVYTGLLPVTRDEAGLAVVMGHEVSHAIANHGNERMSQGLLTQLGGMALAVALSKQPSATQQLFMTVFGVGAQVGFLLPYARTHEYEADKIGLILTAKAGYDPRAAVPLWQRMDKAGKGGRPPEFISTHPHPQNRIKELQAMMPEALRHYRGK